MKRRTFLSYGLYAGALLLAGPRPAGAASQTFARDRTYGVSPLIRILADNRIIFGCPSPDMGQGVSTSLAMIFAEELDADWDRLEVEPLPYELKRLADGNLAPKHIGQASGGSESVRRNFGPLRQMGAAARRLLMQAASRQFGLPLEQLRTERSTVITSDGRSVSYADLRELAAAEELPDGFEPRLKEPSQWRLIGQSKRQTEAMDIVTGRAVYGIDATYPGVKIAVVSRSPYLDGFPKSVDARAARAVPGVIDVVTLERPPLDEYYTYLAAGVAVIAEDFWTARKARDLLDIEWDHGPHASESTQSLNRQFANLLEEEGQTVLDDGDFVHARSQSTGSLTRDYALPFLSHAQLEPQNCIAHVTDNCCTIIGPLQSPGSAGRVAEKLTGIDRVGMDIRYTRLGGGFGRRLTADHAAEAVAISKASGMPIKVMWTREDDLSHDFYRPAGRHRMTACWDQNGNVTGWQHRLASASKYYRRDNRTEADYHVSELFSDDFPRRLIPNVRNVYHSARSGMPRGSWRAPGHSTNAFVVQSFLDEVASALGKDPLELRVSLLDHAEELPYDGHGGPTFSPMRMKNVFELAAERADWSADLPKGRALGLAGHFTFGGYCAHVAEVELTGERSFKVRRVVSAVDIGTVVNPAGVIAQTEGGINDGLSAALRQKIEVRDGQVTTRNFDTYHLLRMADAVPVIDVHIVQSDAPPRGMGEIPLPPLAPAVANAVVRAGGPRLRDFPLLG